MFLIPRKGNDGWSGKFPVQNATNTDDPSLRLSVLAMPFARSSDADFESFESKRNKHFRSP